MAERDMGRRGEGTLPPCPAQLAGFRGLLAACLHHRPEAAPSPARSHLSLLELGPFMPAGAKPFLSCSWGSAFIDPLGATQRIPTSLVGPDPLLVQARGEVFPLTRQMLPKAHSSQLLQPRMRLPPAPFAANRALVL